MDGGKAKRLDTFISYSRNDQAFVRHLFAELEQRGREAWVDWEGIPPTADWMREIFAAIDAANTFIFVLSQSSLGSEVCAKELAHAIEHRKRLVPLALGDIDAELVPDELRQLNWIVCPADAPGKENIDQLTAALDTDLDWVRGHTRLLVRAVEWADASQEKSLLLRGDDLGDAEKWLGQGADKDPKPTELHQQYISASRTQETRRSRQTLAAVATALVVATGLAVFAWTQREIAVGERATANEQREIAEDQRNLAEEQREQAEKERAEAQRQSLAALTNQSTAALRSGDEFAALLSGVKAGRLLQDVPELRADRRSYFRTLVALRRAVFETREANRIDTRHFRGVTDLAFSRDAKSLYSAGGGGEIRRWNLNGELLGYFETGHSGEGDGCTSIARMAVSQDADMIGTLGNAGKFSLWDIDGNELATFRVPSGSGYCTGITSAAIDFTRKTVLVRTTDRTTIYGFDGTSKKSKAEKNEWGDDEIVASADGEHVAESQRSSGIVVRQKDGNVAFRIPRQNSPAFSSDGRLLASVSDGADSQMVHLWWLTTPGDRPDGYTAVPTGEPTKPTVELGGEPFSLATRYASYPRTGVISAGGSAAAILTDRQMGIVQLWKISDGAGAKLTSTVETDQLASADFSAALNSIALSDDGQKMVTGGSDGTVKVWSSKGELLAGFIAHRQDTSARFSPDGELVIAWGEVYDRDTETTRQDIQIWTVDGERLDTLSSPPAETVQFGPDGRWLVATAQTDGEESVWSLDLDHLVREGCERLVYFLDGPVGVADRDTCDRPAQIGSE